LCKSSSQQQQQSPVLLLTLHEEYVPHDVSANTGQNAAKSNGQALGICQATAGIVNELGKVLKVQLISMLNEFF
jgi:hypothetical protein